MANRSPLERSDGGGDRRVRQVHRHDVDDIGNERRAERIHVGPFEAHDTGIGSQSAAQLAVPGVDGVHGRPPRLAAGRS